MNEHKSRKVLDYFLTYLLFAIPFIPFFLGDLFLIIAFIITFFLFLKRNLKIDNFILIYSFVFLFLFISHLLLFSELRITVFIAFFIRIFYAYFTIKLIREKIVDYYVNIIYFFAVISLVFWVVLTFFPESESFLVDNITPFFNKFTYYQPNFNHLIIFNVNVSSQTDFPRNPGPFWEAGGFGVFLVIALIFLAVKTKSLFEKKQIILMITILTTQSTGTYLTFAVFIIWFFIFQKQFKYMLLFLPLFIFLMYYSFVHFPFLKEKIVYNIEYAGGDTSTKGRTRLVSAKEDWKIIQKYPLTGEGRFKFSDAEELGNKGMDYRNNSTVRLAAEFGLFAFFFYFFTMYRSFKIFCKKNGGSHFVAALIVFVIMVAESSQGGLWAKPFFFGLTFFFIFNSKKNLNKNRK